MTSILFKKISWRTAMSNIYRVQRVNRLCIIKIISKNFFLCVFGQALIRKCGHPLSITIIIVAINEERRSDCDARGDATGTEAGINKFYFVVINDFSL